MKFIVIIMMVKTGFSFTLLALIMEPVSSLINSSFFFIKGKSMWHQTFYFPDLIPEDEDCIYHYIFYL